MKVRQAHDENGDMKVYLRPTIFRRCARKRWRRTAQPGSRRRKPARENIAGRWRIGREELRAMDAGGASRRDRNNTIRNGTDR